MRVIKLFVPIYCVVFLYSCNRENRIKSLSSEELQNNEAQISKQGKDIKSLKSISLSQIPKGIKYKQDRHVDPNDKPIVLDIIPAQRQTEVIKLADFAKNVKYSLLSVGKDTLALNSNQIISTDTEHIILQNLLWSVAFRRQNQTIDTLTKNKLIMRGDNPSYSVSIEKPSDIASLSTLFNGKCLYKSFDESKGKSSVFMKNLRSNNIEIEIERGESSAFNLLTPYGYQLDDSTLVELESSITPSPNYFMFSLSMNGDTLCAFSNYEKVVNFKKQSYANPDHWFNYRYKNQLTIRQPYNDTIFRMLSPSKLKPAFVLNFGKQKADINSAVRAQIAGKYIPIQWIEMNNTIFLLYSMNYDCKNNRVKKSVIFYLAVFDKSTSRIFHVPLNGKYLEEIYIENNIDGGLPLSFNHTSCDDNTISTYYTKKNLKEIIESKQYSNLSVSNQKAIADWFEKMNANELLVMEIW